VGSVSFSERQQHCLEAMGIVPWVSRNPEPEAVPYRSFETVLSTENRLAESSEQVVDSSHVVATDLPSDLDALGLWLPEQPLASFGYKGAEHTILGHPEASVLVVVQRNRQNDREMPLSGDAAQLFELMMRSINLGRSDVRQCALAGKMLPSDGQKTVVQSVSDACTPQTRAILLLLPLEANNDPSADAHYCRSAQSQLPVWRISHPDILLQENQRKRQAWQAMKALQQYLTA
jgi:hypothetical protein